MSKESMSALELNFRLLKGAIDMREDEKRWHEECFGHLGVEMVPHQWTNIEKVVGYWRANHLMPHPNARVQPLPPMFLMPEDLHCPEEMPAIN